MKLYLVHHGEAVPKSVNPERPLTPRGRQELAKLAMFLGNAGVQVARVLHSTKQRAHDTAVILAERLAPGVTLEERHGICPDDAIEPLLGELLTCRVDLLVAGHGPFMVRLVSRLLAGSIAPEFVISLPGSAFCLERDASGIYRLCWMIRPELLEMM